MRCCWREVDEERVLGPCWAGAAVVIMRGAFVVLWKAESEGSFGGHVQQR